MHRSRPREICTLKSIAAIFTIWFNCIDGDTARGRELPGILQDAEDGTTGVTDADRLRNVIRQVHPRPPLALHRSGTCPGRDGSRDLISLTHRTPNNQQ